MWVRGLKHTSKVNRQFFIGVAPYVGAWIETLPSTTFVSRVSVAPYVGAWIETDTTAKNIDNATVAPYVGAWIETIGGVTFRKRGSRTLCGCVD